MAYRMKVKEGGSLGDLYGKGFSRDDNGKIQYDDDGLPTLTANRDDVYLGNSNPDCTLGWSNTFSFYGVNISFLIDGSWESIVIHSRPTGSIWCQQKHRRSDGPWLCRIRR